MTCVLGDALELHSSVHVCLCWMLQVYGGDSVKSVLPSPYQAMVMPGQYQYMARSVSPVYTFWGFNAMFFSQLITVKQLIKSSVKQLKTERQRLYEDSKRRVLRCLLKVLREVAEQTVSGRLFHTQATPTPNARSPTVQSSVCGTDQCKIRRSKVRVVINHSASIWMDGSYLMNEWSR